LFSFLEQFSFGGEGNEKQSKKQTEEEKERKKEK
jgi:hypothetical protein